MPAVADLTIRQGDTLPALAETITDANGNVINLTGGSATLVMRGPLTTAPQVNAAMTVTNATAGQVSYAWSATDTATAGLYAAEIHVTTPAGTFTYPSDGYLTIEIVENLTAGPQTIVTLGDAKDYLIIDAGDHTQDAKILRFIRGVQTVIESYTGPIIPKVFDEWYDGGSPFLRLRKRPSLALSSNPFVKLIACSEYVGPIEWPLAIIPSPDQGQLYSCMLDPTTLNVVRRTAGGGVQSFPSGEQAVHVIYQAGQSTVPWNIYQGTLELLREQYRDTQQQPMGNSPYNNDDEAESEEALHALVSGRVLEWIAPTRKHPSVA